MAIAFDSSSNGVATDVTLSFNHTTSGANRLLVVHVVIRTNGATITSVKYNNVSMTQAATVAMSGAANSISRTYYLVNPASGTNSVDIVVTSSTAWLATSASFTGVLQTSPLDTTTTDNSGGTGTYAPSLSAAVAGELYVMGVGNPNSSGTLSASSGTTLAVQNTTTNTRDGLFYKIASSAGSNTLNGANSVVIDYGLTLVNFKPATTLANVKSIDGLGISSVKTINGLAVGSTKTWNGLS